MGTVYNEIKVIREVAVLEESNTGVFRLCLVTTGKMDHPHLDLRFWRRKDDGGLEPRNGVAILSRQAKILCVALFEYLGFTIAKQATGEDAESAGAVV